MFVQFRSILLVLLSTFLHKTETSYKYFVRDNFCGYKIVQNLRQFYLSWILSRPWQPRRGIVGYEEHSRRPVRMRSRPLHTCLSRARFLVKLWVRIKNFFVFKFTVVVSSLQRVSFSNKKDGKIIHVPISCWRLLSVFYYNIYVTLPH